MPQLSIETFVSQYFWLVLILFSLYYIMITKLLPAISEGIKARGNIDSKALFQKSIIKDSSLIKEISSSLQLIPTIPSSSYNSTFVKNFLSWSNKK